MWEKFDRQGNALTVSFGDVQGVTAIMVHRRSNIPTAETMASEGASFVRRFEDERFGTWWGDGRSVVIKVTIELCLSRQSGIDS